MTNQQEGVLLVDDEDIVREITSMMLEDSGFTVFATGSARDALEVYQRNQKEISVAILDFSMPEMTGYELAVELRAMDGKIGIVMISGLAITAEVSKLQREGGLVFISKPFENQLLVKSLRKALAWRTQSV